MIKDIGMYIGLAFLSAAVILGLANVILPMTEEIRIVTPYPGIRCAVVSRMAHTSIDCWEEEKQVLEVNYIDESAYADTSYQVQEVN